MSATALLDRTARAAIEELEATDDVEFGVRLLANTPTHESRDPARLRQWARTADEFGAALAPVACTARVVESAAWPGPGPAGPLHLPAGPDRRAVHRHPGPRGGADRPTRLAELVSGRFPAGRGDRPRDRARAAPPRTGEDGPEALPGPCRAARGTQASVRPCRGRRRDRRPRPRPHGLRSRPQPTPADGRPGHRRRRAATLLARKKEVTPWASSSFLSWRPVSPRCSPASCPPPSPSSSWPSPSPSSRAPR